jgi:hypothetical protein
VLNASEWIDGLSRRRPVIGHRHARLSRAAPAISRGSLRGRKRASSCPCRRRIRPARRHRVGVDVPAFRVNDDDSVRRLLEQSAIINADALPNARPFFLDPRRTGPGVGGRRPGTRFSTDTGHFTVGYRSVAANAMDRVSAVTGAQCLRAGQDRAECRVVLAVHVPVAVEILGDAATAARR